MAQTASKIDQVQHRAIDQGEITLLELVAALADVAETDGEVVAAVTDLINSGRVQLVGNFQGADVRVTSR